MPARFALAERPAATPFAVGLPELLALRARLGAAPASLRASRQPAAALPGAHASVLPGRGLEFAELRDYRPGDDPRRIDWRHTARRGRPFTKVFFGERERPLWLLVDVGPTMRFATRGVFKSVQAVRAGALLAWAAVGAGDRVGGGVFAAASRSVDRLLLPPAGREAGAARLLRVLAEASAAGAGEDSGTALAAAVRRLAPQLRTGDEVAVVSDFADPRFEAMLKPLAARVSLTLIRIVDPLEVAPPPPAVYPIVDADGEREIDLRDPALRTAWGATGRERRTLLDRITARGDAWHGELATDEDPLLILRRRHAGELRPALA